MRAIDVVSALRPYLEKLAHPDHVAGHRTTQRLAQKTLSERLCPAGTQSNTMHDKLSLVGQKRIVLDFMAEHGPVASFILQANACGERCANFSNKLPLLFFSPGSRHSEIDAIGIRFDQRHTALLQGRKHLREDFPPAPCHFVSSMHIREKRH